jgi:hypothetical protein
VYQSANKGTCSTVSGGRHKAALQCNIVPKGKKIESCRKVKPKTKKFSVINFFFKGAKRA